MKYIYHIVNRTEYQKAEKSGLYVPSDFDKEGYIHCSYADQVCGIGDIFYSENEDLILLEIDKTSLSCEVKDEDDFQKGNFYPHIYGELPVEAVTARYKFEKGSDGFFGLPDIVLEKNKSSSKAL